MVKPSKIRRLVVLPAAVLAALAPSALSACSSGAEPVEKSPLSVDSTATSGRRTEPATTAPSRAVPQPDHVVVVMFENERASSIIGNPDAPYINSLAAGGANFTESYAITHPSQPNYIALFSGSTHGVTDDACTHNFKANNQAHQLLTAGFTFMSYAEDLPAPGSKVCSAGKYARKHAPWTDFSNVPADVQQPFTSFPSDYTTLPDVSWVIPNLCNDMHDCSIATGDSWLQANLGDYATWAQTHNSLLIVDFDEDDYSGDNQIATIFYGGDIVPGDYSEHITHYSVLRTMEDMYGLSHLQKARTAKSIKDVWK